ncbi:MAG: NUDIX domain-containing protein [Bacteroidota bacterium]|nr:NUDIX domain-containing protein [Bacteroidota bacterium]
MKRSAGLLLYRFKNEIPEFFLVHPGGPYWRNKDIGSWSIPKGEVEEGEDHLSAAIREVGEETGIKIDSERHKFIDLKEVSQNPGKKVIAWAVEFDLDEAKITSNHFEIEWPPRSGKKQTFPEVDKAGWFGFEEARKKILPGQAPLLEELNENFI